MNVIVRTELEILEFISKEQDELEKIFESSNKTSTQYHQALGAWNELHCIFDFLRKKDAE